MPVCSFYLLWNTFAVPEEVLVYIGDATGSSRIENYVLCIFDHICGKYTSIHVMEFISTIVFVFATGLSITKKGQVTEMILLNRSKMP